MSLGAAAIALVDDRYGHSIEVAAVRLQVHQPQADHVFACLILCLIDETYVQCKHVACMLRKCALW